MQNPQAKCISYLFACLFSFIELLPHQEGAYWTQTDYLWLNTACWSQGVKLPLCPGPDTGGANSNNNASGVVSAQPSLTRHSFCQEGPPAVGPHGPEFCGRPMSTCPIPEFSAPLGDPCTGSTGHIFGTSILKLSGLPCKINLDFSHTICGPHFSFSFGWQ